VNTSAIFRRPTDASMYSKVKILRDKISRFMEDTTEPTKDGRYFILTRRQRPKPRD
jgi:hypothetical protein